MKKDKTFYSLIFAIVVLSILLVLSLYLGISGWFFSNEKSHITDFKLGNNLKLIANKNQATSMSQVFNGSFLSGEKFNQIIAIKNFEQEEALFLRAKAFVYSSANENEPLNLVTTNGWVYNEQDGYYYFNKSLPAQNKISLCTQVYLDEEYVLTSNQNYVITFLIETLSVEHEIEAFWGYNFIE